MSSLVHLIKADGAEVVLSSFCHFLHDEVREQELHLKYKQIILEENEIVKTIAMEKKCSFVQVDKVVPQQEQYFLDTIHFTPEGMQVMAEAFGAELLRLKSMGVLE